MPTLKGRAAEDRRRAAVPEKVKRMLRGAARAGAQVIAEEAKRRVPSDAVRNGVVIGRARERDGEIRVKITVQEGWPRSLGTWLEYGTGAHFISVDPRFAEGRTAQRVNRLDRDAANEGRQGPGSTLIINGKPVGTTVFHPGSRAEPWLRPARDEKAADAVSAAQEYITARVNRGAGKAGEPV